MAQESGLMSGSLLYLGAALLCLAVCSHPGWSFDRSPTVEEVGSAVIGTRRAQLSRCGPESLGVFPSLDCAIGFADETLRRALISGLFLDIVLSVFIEDLSWYERPLPVGLGGGIHYVLALVSRIQLDYAELRRRLPNRRQPSARSADKSSGSSSVDWPAQGSWTLRGLLAADQVIELGGIHKHLLAVALLFLGSSTLASRQPKDNDPCERPCSKCGIHLCVRARIPEHEGDHDCTDCNRPTPWKPIRPAPKKPPPVRVASGLEAESDSGITLETCVVGDAFSERCAESWQPRDEQTCSLDRDKCEQRLVDYTDNCFREGLHIRVPRYAVYKAILVHDCPRKKNPRVLPVAASWIIFDGYFRPSECIDLIRPPRSASCSQYAITLPRTKNQSTDTGVVVGHHDRSWLAPVVGALCSGLEAWQPLFRGLGDDDLRKLFSPVAARRGGHLVPHQLRHGGATVDGCLFKDSIEAVQARGRWLVLSSCRQYMKPASMLRSLSKLSSEQLREAKQFAKGVGSIMLHAVSQVLEFWKGKT